MPDTTKRGTVPQDRPLQWQDISQRSRVDLNAQVRDLGKAASGISEQRASLEAVRDRPSNKPKTRKKAEQRLSTLGAMEEAGVYRDRPITHAGAAEARVNLTLAGAKRTREEGTDPGHNWYFEHHNKLARIADATGHDKNRVIAASAVMSPQNNPEQELSAVTHLAMAHSNPSASITVGAAAARADPSLGDFVGRSMHPSEFSAEQLSALSSADPEIRGNVQTKGVNLAGIAAGGTKENISKAIDVLRGDVHPDEAINPQSSPKVWSYHNAIRNAVWGSPEQEEFTRRMRSTTNLIAPGAEGGQGSFDLFPELKGATHGILSPTATTAEDTWQQAVSSRQQLEAIEIPGRVGRAHVQSPAKFGVGEGGAASEKGLRAVEGLPNVKNAALMHAWQNQATVLAAGRLSKASGEIVPAVGVQAGGWTEGRRQAGKAMEENDKVKRVSSPQQFSMLTPSNKVSPKAKVGKGQERQSLRLSPEEHARDAAAVASLRARTGRR
jgi:hypothetical protein